ncbi:MULTISPECIES: DUF6895 family protein [Microtetraspora]|uniref:DUF6895 family protein n=1 Tax=Microtetraspora TaxID=1995 RepID=UPI00082FEB37|nr:MULTISPECIES: hypothetical protein [Microtetraspora]
MTGPIFDTIADGAVRWLHQHLDRFRLSTELRASDILQPPLLPERSCTACLRQRGCPDHPRHRYIDALWWGRALTPLTELALAGTAVLRASDPRTDRHRLAHEMVDMIWKEIDAGEVLFALLKAEPGEGSVLSLYAFLRERGRRHAGIEHIAAQLVTTRNWSAKEVAPFHLLARLTSQRALGLPVEHVDLEEAITRTWLARTPEPWLLDHHHAYALTHTVFYLTDWGRAPAHLPTALAAYLNDWLPCWSQVWCEEEDWDLLGELLAVDACLPQPTLDERLWNHLAQAQLPDGSIPGPRFPSRGIDQADGDAYTYNRHSTIVAAVAASWACARAANRAATTIS